MSTPLHELLSSESGPASDLNDHDYLQFLVQEFRRNSRSQAELRQQPTVAAERALTAGELAALDRVGLVADESMRRDADRARKESAYVFFRALQTSLSTAEVADLLNVNASRIRQRVKERTLLALTDAGDHRFPSLLFHKGREVPGLREVLPALPADIKPFEVMAWLATPNIELGENDEDHPAPRDYLLATGDTAPVIALARALRRGEAS